MARPDGGGRYVGLRPEALRQLIERYRLVPAEHLALIMLTLNADHLDGIWRGTQPDLAALVGVYRKNLRPRLKRLENLGLIECYWPPGHQGAVRVSVYCDLVHLSAPQGAKHPLRKGQLPPLRDVIHKGRNTPSAGAKHPLRAVESAGHSGSASGLGVSPGSAEASAARNGNHEGSVVALHRHAHEQVDSVSTPEGSTCR